jgi:hypothetical protein
VEEHLCHYAESSDAIIDRWDEKLCLQARWESGGFDEYKEVLNDDLDTVNTCRDSWNMVIPGNGKTGHELFSELIEDCSEKAIAGLRERVEHKEKMCEYEHLLNSEKFNGALNVEDQKRREYRSTIRNSINDAKEIRDDAHELSEIQGTELAAHWETQIWTDHPVFRTYLIEMDNFESDLMDWTQNWHSVLDNGKTGEQNFIEYIHQNPDRQVLQCELRRVLNSIFSTVSPGDPLAGFFTQIVAEIRESSAWSLTEESMVEHVRIIQEECKQLNRWHTHWTNVYDRDLTGEQMFRQYYSELFGVSHFPDRTPEDHGLNSQTVAELFDLARGNDTPSDCSASDAGSSGLSDEFLESNGQDLVSPRSPKSYDSSEDDDTDGSLGSAAQDQSGNQSAAFNMSTGSSSVPSSDIQIAKPVQTHPVIAFHETLASSNRPQAGNTVSTVGITAAMGTPPHSLPTIPIPGHNTVHVGEDMAMEGLAYHPLSKEVGILDGNADLPAQEEAVDMTPLGGFTADFATSTEDAEMAGSDVSETLDDNGKPSDPSATIATGNVSGFFSPYATSSHFSPAPQLFNGPALTAKNESIPSGTMFNLEGLSLQGQTTTVSATSLNSAMREPVVPQNTLQASMSPRQVVEKRLGEPLTNPAKTVFKTVFANVPQKEGEEDDKDELTEKRKFAEFKTVSVAPAVLITSQLTLNFTFKPPKGGFLPILPSGFDAGSWSGGFDFKPPVDDDKADTTSSSGEVGSILKTTKVQKPEVDGPVDGVGADEGHDVLGSAAAGIDVDVASVPEDIKQESLAAGDESFNTSDALDVMNSLEARMSSLNSQCVRIDAINAEADEHEQTEALQGNVEDAEENSEDDFEEDLEDESEDCSSHIKELASTINTCSTYWLDANSGNNAPSAFIKIAEDLQIVMENINSEGDWKSPSALSKMEALSTKWQMFITTIKAYIDITTHSHPDYDYRLERFLEQYRSDIVMISEYESLNQLPGTPDIWRNEANKRREARDSKFEFIFNEISIMQGLYQAYCSALETLRVHIDCEALEEMADETLICFHAKIVRASDAFGLQYMETFQRLSDPLDCGWCTKDAQEASVYIKQRKTPPTSIADDEEW